MKKAWIDDKALAGMLHAIEDQARLERIDDAILPGLQHEQREPEPVCVLETEGLGPVGFGQPARARGFVHPPVSLVALDNRWLMRKVLGRDVRPIPKTRQKARGQTSKGPLGGR